MRSFLIRCHCRGHTDRSFKMASLSFTKYLLTICIFQCGRIHEHTLHIPRKDVARSNPRPPDLQSNAHVTELPLDLWLSYQWHADMGNFMPVHVKYEKAGTQQIIQKCMCTQQRHSLVCALHRKLMTQMRTTKTKSADVQADLSFCNCRELTKNEKICAIVFTKTDMPQVQGQVSQSDARSTGRGFDPLVQPFVEQFQSGHERPVVLLCTSVLAVYLLTH